MCKKIKSDNRGYMSVFLKKQCVCIVTLILCAFLPSVTVQATRLSPAGGAAVEKHILNALQDRYQGRLEMVEDADGTESYLQLLVTFEKHQLPNIILVVNVLNRSISESTGKVASNIIQIQAFPQIQPLLPKGREQFMSAVREWQYTHVLPQRVYLTPESHVVYGWGIPLYDKESLDSESLAQIIDELASLWVEFGGFLKEKGAELHSLVTFNDKVVNEPSLETVALDVQVEEPKVIVEIVEPEDVVQSISAPNFSIVETLNLLSGGRGMRPESQKKFTAFLETIKGKSAKAIIVRGYVSSDSDTKENQLFSLKRAERVAQMMLDAGVSSGRVSVEGMGIQNPVASNATSEGRDKNRRVEILLQDE